MITEVAVILGASLGVSSVGETVAGTPSPLTAPAELVANGRSDDPPPAPEAAKPAEAPAKPPDPDSFFKGWKGTIEGGLNGSSGNTDSLSLRFGVAGKRETSKMITAAWANYNYATNDGDKTKSRGELGIRNDWNLTDRWIFFAKGLAEYDEFQRWDWRLSAFAGPGYYFVKEDRTKLLGRLGFGITKELGDQAENRIYPELDFGFDFEHKLTDRQKIFVSADYYPDVGDLWEYRAVAKAGWEILVDPEVNMTLKIGVEDRYDHHQRDPQKKNDVDYFILIAWTF